MDRHKFHKAVREYIEMFNVSLRGDTMSGFSVRPLFCVILMDKSFSFM